MISHGKGRKTVVFTSICTSFQSDRTTKPSRPTTTTNSLVSDLADLEQPAAGADVRLLYLVRPAHHRRTHGTSDAVVVRLAQSAERLPRTNQPAQHKINQSINESCQLVACYRCCHTQTNQHNVNHMNLVMHMMACYCCRHQNVRVTASYRGR